MMNPCPRTGHMVLPFSFWLCGKSEGEVDLLAPPTLLCLSPQALKTLKNGASLPVLEGQSLRLVCVAESNPPATMSWSREGKALSPSQPSAPGVLELPQVGAGDGGEFTCRAQNPLGSQHVSFSLSVQSELQDSCWPGQPGPVFGRGDR